MQTSTFWLKFGSSSPAVILKIRSMSPKPYQLFNVSQCYIHANLVKIHQPVHIVPTRNWLTPTPRGFEPKIRCQPTEFWRKFNTSNLSTVDLEIWYYLFVYLLLYCFILTSEILNQNSYSPVYIYEKKSKITVNLCKAENSCLNALQLSS